MLFRISAAAAILASGAMVTAPLAAADVLPQPVKASVQSVGEFDAGSVNADRSRRWRRDRIDAGDIIGGLLVIGTVAAVASAASNVSRAGRYRDRDYRYPSNDYRRDYRGPAAIAGESREIGRIVDSCAREVERRAPIDTVDGVNRAGNSWDVSGRLRSGESFRCAIGNDGRINAVDYGVGSGYRGSADDRQWDDDRYAAARAEADGYGSAQVSGLPPVPPPTEDRFPDTGGTN